MNKQPITASALVPTIEVEVEIASDLPNTTTEALRPLLTEINDHFEYKGSQWVLDSENPPSLEDAYDITSRIAALHSSADNIKDEACWLLGNIILECRDFFGDEYDIDQMGETLGLSYNTLVTSESVALEWGHRRIEGLTFTHHKEVHYTKDLTDSQKLLILQEALRLGLNTKQTRRLASLVKKQGDDILMDGLEDTEIMGRIEEPPTSSKRTYVCITYDNVITQIKEDNLDDDKCTRFRMIIQTAPDLEIIKDVQDEVDAVTD